MLFSQASLFQHLRLFIDVIHKTTWAHLIFLVLYYLYPSLCVNFPFGKIEHENGLKCWPWPNRIIWMQIIRKFNYKFKEVSRVEIGVKLLKLWNLEVQFWVPILKTIGNTVKPNMKMGYNFDPRVIEKF